jgi:DNA invertase Pin-like site-specific DNA recombinase
MRVAVYLNVSKRAGDRVMEDQLAAIQQAAPAEGWQITQIYRDRASAKNDRRPALERVRSDAMARRFDLLLFWEVKRLSVEGPQAVYPLLCDLACQGIGFRSYEEPWVDSYKLLTESLHLALTRMARRQHNHISQRTKAAMNLQRMEGGPPPGRPRAQWNENKALRLRTEGKSYAQIAVACSASKSVIVRFFKAKEKRTVQREIPRKAMAS